MLTAQAGKNEADPQPVSPTARYDGGELTSLVAEILRRMGMSGPIAANVAESLVEADMMGHSTHGIALLPWYTKAIRDGVVRLAGDPVKIADLPACLAFEAERLPGSWVISQAIDIALDRVRTQGLVTATACGSFHTGALAVYLPRITSKGFMGIVSCSGPAAQTVAPFGGREPVFTPNPLAAGIPTDGDPILLDISASITTNNRARQLAAEGGTFPGEWVLDADGRPTDDPKVVFAGGSLLPVGGLDHGHKGYALTLLVEALANGLAGRGRRNGPSGIVINTFIQIIDPAAFGGAAAFIDEMSWLRGACLNSAPRPDVEAVRLPGQKAMANRRAALKHGIPLSHEIEAGLRETAASVGIEIPDGERL